MSEYPKQGRVRLGCESCDIEINYEHKDIWIYEYDQNGDIEGMVHIPLSMHPFLSHAAAVMVEFSTDEKVS